MQRITRNRDIPRQPAQVQEEQNYVIAPLSVRISMAVKMTGIGRSKLYELIQEGAIDVVKIGSSTLIPVASLERLLERNRR
jgi:excisionase family DNA binding protein